jgi:hypothetical protein
MITDSPAVGGRCPLREIVKREGLKDGKWKEREKLSV